jgi:hypothetical protein
MSANPEKYQLLPELDPESFAALKADIAARGVVVPVLVDEFGVIIDGHNRAQACRELGINDYPVEVRSGLSEAEKRTLARKLNVLRRHLSREQVRQLIGDQLRDTPEWADRRIGRELGVDHKTVAAVRADLGSTGEIPQLAKTVGDDDKARPAKPSRRRRKQATDNECDDDDWDDDGDRPRRRRVDPWNDPAKQAKFRHAVDLIKLGVDPNSEQVNKLLLEASVCVFHSPDPFANISDEQRREWLLYLLWGIQAGYSPEYASHYCEWLKRNGWNSPTEWHNDEGDTYRSRRAMTQMSDETKESWAALLKHHCHTPLADIEAEIRRLADEHQTKIQRAEEEKRTLLERSLKRAVS